ncbi:MAG: acyl-CoA desaturase [Saprospiraceae bacterium]|nr:acyl-CoA desaturase [Saprospiraceae bacterium]
MQAPRFTATPSFYNDLRRRVNQYFTEVNSTPTGNWQLYSKAIFLIVAHVAIYVTLVFFTPVWWISLPLCAILGLLTAGIGFNIMHDGGHGSFSKSKALNRAAAFSLNILGGSDFMWNIKHNVIHHSFTNVDGVDDDIDVNPFLRMCRTQTYRWFHRFQHVYFVILYAVMYLFWMFFLDYKKYFRGYIGVVEITHMKPVQHIIFWGSKFFSYFLFLILPILVVGFVPTLIGFGVFVTVTGFVISIIFQLAHTVEHTDFPIPAEDGKIENEWAIHQVQTTANFATRNKLVTWFCGGLNFQIEHHLFPKVSHIHYPAISRIVREACQEYGIQYIEFPRVTSAVASHYRLLRNLGRA